MTLLLSSLTVGALHALAPDHWLPFVALSRVQNWSVRKTALVTLGAGMIHVAASLILGVAGIFFGKSVAEISHWEEMRGEWFSFLMIGFGLTYMLWAVKQFNKAKVEQQRSGENETFYWIYFAIFVLGPCEPLIPFLFVSKEGTEMMQVVLLFSSATLTVMTAAACVVSKRLETARLPKIFSWSPKSNAGRNSLIPARSANPEGSFFAGAAIALTGLAVRILGI